LLGPRATARGFDAIDSGNALTVAGWFCTACGGSMQKILRFSERIIKTAD